MNAINDKKIFYLLMFLSVFFLQSCNEKVEVISFTSDAVPVEIKQAHEECMKLASSNACLISKNSVYQRNTIHKGLKPGYKNSQTLAVNIDSLDNSGYLQNENLSVYSYKHPRVQAVRGSWKFPYEKDNGVKLSQVMAYYYASLVFRSPLLHASTLNKNIKLLTHAPVTGWSSRDNTIYLGVYKNGQNNALDGSVIMHLIGEANIYYATQERVYNLDSGQHHNSCGSSNKNMCCSSMEGCSKAMSIGASDYLVSTFFTDRPTIGETYANSLSGLNACGLSRDLEINKDLAVNKAFNACSSRPGYIYPMATVYASIWWNVRKKIMATRPNDLSDLDRLHSKYLGRFIEGYNFVSAFNVIKNIDNAYFSSKFSSEFYTEFKRRGINVD